jgi:hypothetical protein
VLLACPDPFGPSVAEGRESEAGAAEVGRRGLHVAGAFPLLPLLGFGDPAEAYELFGDVGHRLGWGWAYGAG